MLLEMPKSVEGRGPSMATLVEIARILEDAKGEAPLSLAEVARRMPAKRVRHSTVRACVDFLDRLGYVTAGSRGVQWTFVRDKKLWKTVRRGVPLAQAR